MATSNNSASLTVSTSAATRALSTRSARRLSAFITFRTHGGMEFAKALAVVVFGASEVVVATAAVVSTSTIDAAILVATAPSIVIVLGRALRPATTTRACLKARARLSMARASRRANRVSRKARRRTQSVSVAKCPILLARTAHRTLRRTLRRGVRVFAMAVVAVATRVVVAAAVQNTTVRPVLKEEVHTCALPRPVLVVEYVPLATQRPVVRATRPAHKSLATTAIEVEPLVVTAPAVKILSLAEKEAARVAKADAKEAYSAWQADCIAAKAAYKKANPYTSSKDKGANPKGKKNNGGGGSRKRALYTPPQRPEILSQRADLGIKAGPTDNNNYNWKPMSDMELASFFYGEEIDGVPIADMGLSEVPTPMTSSPCFSGDNLYNLVLNMAGIPPRTTPVVTATVVTSAPAEATSAYAKRISNARSFGIPTSTGKKTVVNPAAMLTELMFALPKNWFKYQTLMVNYAGGFKKGGHLFSGAGATVQILKNTGLEGTKGAGDLYVANSYARLYTCNEDNGTDAQGTEYVFSTWMENMLNASVQASNEAVLALQANNETALALLELYSNEITEALANGIASTVEEFFASIEEEFTTPVEVKAPIRYMVLVTETVKDEKGKNLLDANGKIQYAFNTKKIESDKAVWEAQGYEVIGIKPVLKMSTLNTLNFRIDGEVPCEPLSDTEIKALGITQWTMDNYHEAVKPVADISDWLTKVIASKVVKSMSISYNSITTPDSVQNAFKGNDTEHHYAFTTSSDKYAGVSTTLPAFTINLWTTEVIPEGIVPDAVVVGHQVHKGRVKGVLANAMYEVLAQKTRATGVEVPTKHALGTPAKSAFMVKKEAAAAKALADAQAAAELAAAASALAGAQAEDEDDAQAQTTVQADVVVLVEPPIEDEFLSALDDIFGGLMFGLETVTPPAMELEVAPITVEAVEAPALGRDVEPDTDVSADVTPPVATPASVSVANYAANLQAANWNTSTDDDDDDDEENILGFKCERVSLVDIAMPDGYLAALEAMAVSQNLTLKDLGSTNRDFGMIMGNDIFINEALVGSHRAQVILHELFHYICARLGEENAEGLISEWLDTVGQSNYTPTDSSLEEQAAYSFMGYAHDLDMLAELLIQARACAMARYESKAFDDTLWANPFRAIEDAIGAVATVITVDKAPIAIVKDGAALVATNHVTDALSKIGAGASATQSTGRHLLVMCAPTGKVPVIYQEAMPALKIPAMKLGEHYTAVINGVTVHAICAADEARNTLYPNQLRMALVAIRNEQGSKQTYVCEEDLGFEDNIATTSTILACINNILGQRAKIITMRSMKTAVKQWGTAGHQPVYAKADLDIIMRAALTPGSSLTLVPIGSHADGSLVDAEYYGQGNVSMAFTLAVLDAENKVDANALAEAIAILESHMEGIQKPIYVYSCQKDAFTTLSTKVEVVEYAEGALLPNIKVGVLTKSPTSDMIGDWYMELVGSLDSKKGGLDSVKEVSEELFAPAFSVLGLPVHLACYALSPIPMSMLKNGVVLVVPGVGADGLIEVAVEYEELIDKALLRTLLGLGVKVYTAEWVFDKTAKRRVFKGKSAQVHGEFGCYALPDGAEGEDMLVLKGNECEFVNGNVIGTNISNKAVKSLPQYMQKHLLDTIQYLVDTKGVGTAVRYMEAVLPKFVKRAGEYVAGKWRLLLGVYNKAKSAEYYMEFTQNEGKLDTDWDWLSAKNCTICSTTKDMEVNKITNLSGFPDTLYDAVTVAIGLAISAGSGREMTQNVWEGYLASITNMFARQDNYGLKLITEETAAGWSITDTLRVIIDNSGKTISATANQNMTARGVALGREEGARWPYHMPCNASLDLAVMEVLMKRGELVVCDKYAMDRIIVGDGARAMLAAVLTPEQAEKLKGYDEDFGVEIALDPVNGRVIYTVCWPIDKASKALNRPSQFWGATQADGWLEALEWSKLTTLLSNGNRAGIRGTKVQIIATNDFLNQGSGIASMFSKEARRITYKVDGTMRFTLDWAQVPTVQQNQYSDGHPQVGQHKPGLTKQVNGPAQNEGPDGKKKDNTPVPVTQWLCGSSVDQPSIKKNIIIPAIEAAMRGPKGEYRVYEPGEVMVEVFKAAYKQDGEELVGFYPDGTTPGLPASKLVMFSNDMGNQKVIITGYRFQTLANGEQLQVILSYATVSDSMADNWSGAKLRGLGIKAIIGYDGTIKYKGTAPLNGVGTDLNELYRNGAIHFTPEGLKGNYAFMQGFAAAHGSAHMSGPYLVIDEILMDGTPNEHYKAGSPDMESDMTDPESYFSQWVRDNTRTIRMQKTVSKRAWDKIVEYNATKTGSTNLADIMPGLVIISENDAAIAWDISKKDAPEYKTKVEDVLTVTVEYDVQVLVFDYWVQIEVADPGACTGVQGMTAEQLANLALVEFHTAEELWRRGEASRDGVRLAVESARTHTEIEAGFQVDGVFTFDPMDASHNALMRQLQYVKSDTGVYSARPAKDFFILLATLFGGAGADTAGLWKEMLDGNVTHIDYIEGPDGKKEIVFFNDGYDYLANEGGVKGLLEYITALSGVDDEGNTEIYVPGKGLKIVTKSGNDANGAGPTTATTYLDPTVFLQLGAFESVLVAADPAKNEPSKRVTGAATGIVNDIYKAFQQWGTAQFWLRKSVTGAIHSKNSLLRNSMLGWIGVNSKENTMMNAKGVLGRIARIGNYACVGAKIRNGIGMEFEPHRIFNADGTITYVPVAVMHPDCLAAKGLRHGDVVGIGRTPTVSLAFCIVKLSRQFGTIGYIGMSFYDWAGGNNGDTDGDPCNRLVVGVYRKGEWRGVTPLRAAKMNLHALSMGGYDIVCGKEARDHDCAEFVSFKTAWSKKVINNSLIPAAIADWAVANSIKIKPLEALVNFLLPSSLLDSAKKVSGHYRANVGTAYGWCSAYSAHMKEKHSYMERVVTNLLEGNSQSFVFGWKYEMPSVQEMMEVLISGEIYDSMGIVPVVVEEIVFNNNTQDYFFFSNMHSETIEYNGIAYMSLESAYQAQKDPANARKFSRMSAFEARKVGRDTQVTNLRPDWDQVKDGIMKELLAIKFSNPLLMSDLVNTGHAVLVHNSPWDLYWGTNGVDGENMLGKMLMDLRNTPPAVVEEPTISPEVRAKYPAIIALCEYKATPANDLVQLGLLEEGQFHKPCDLIQMGQHVKVMLEASAWLWRGIYEGLGLSGYSPSAHAFFESFTIALRNKGKVADCSIKDDKGNVILTVPAYPAKSAIDDTNNTTDQGDDDAETTASSSTKNIALFLSEHYHMSIDAANEIYAACLLYNGYRAIEKGQHIQGTDSKVPTTYQVYNDLYLATMAQWDDTEDNEFVQHSILAGVFRRAGQGTTGVSIDDELSTSTASEMIYRCAQKVWIGKLVRPDNLDPEVAHNPKIFFNEILNDIAVKSVELYTELVEISQISGQ
ncbi:hypothetical protein [Microcoleus phage My-WqHQDG]|nr:hypothetical protein [Microcoleus phage My-WqHQDG]